jgi:sulfite reductase beta subunit-like hemoprotein
LGGDHLGKRLNRLFLELVDDSKLSLIISKLIEHWKVNRETNEESFGDFYNDQDFEKIKQLVQ